MKIPSSFKKAIANTFFDKTLYVYSSIKEKDAYGMVKDAVSEYKSIKCNWNFGKLDLVKKEYGLLNDIAITITTHENIAVNTIVGDGVFMYKIVKAIPRDSHYFLIGEKWLLVSPTSSSL